MKKIMTIISTVILSLILTFIIAEVFSIYHFGGSITKVTLTYVIALFSIIEYLMLSVIYVIVKKKNKEKLGFKKIIGMILFFISLILVLYFIIRTTFDWTFYNFNSAPFYITIIVNGVMMLLPAIILTTIGSILWIKK